MNMEFNLLETEWAELTNELHISKKREMEAKAAFYAGASTVLDVFDRVLRMRKYPVDEMLKGLKEECQQFIKRGGAAESQGFKL
jgi:hypothetical protein